MLTLETIKEAQRALSGIVRVTPLTPAPKIGANVGIKAENLQLVEVFNLMGQQVLSTTMATVDMSGLYQGVYFVRIAADGKTVTKRVVKQ